jgi:hypothetical protein
MPSGEIDVSPCRTSTSSGCTPSSSAAIWDHVVSWPWPCGEVPMVSVTLPLGWHRTCAASQPPAAYRSAPRMFDGASPDISM